MLILLAAIIFTGGWLIFVKNKQEGSSNWVLCLVMLISPVLYHFIGLVYASYLHDQGQAFGSAILAFLLVFNSLVMIGVNMIKSGNKKDKSINS